MCYVAQGAPVLVRGGFYPLFFCHFHSFTDEGKRLDEVRVKNKANEIDELSRYIISLIIPMGYELAHLEVHTHRHGRLRVFIDRKDEKPVRLDDCERVSRALDEPLENHQMIGDIFSGKYDLEVSSPGLDRPLRKAEDFKKFSGKRARIFIQRPLEKVEMDNPEYYSDHSRQRDFTGYLSGFEDSFILFNVSQKKKKEEILSLIRIPLQLVTKAHLEPVFD